MGRNNPFWKKKQKLVDLKRKKGSMKPDQTFLIVCEGEKTEPNYFKSFKLSNATIKIDGTGKNTLSLITHVKDNYNINDYDQVWAVFDKDSFPEKSFNAAVKSRKIRIAYSNEAFEMWYLLHFDYFSTGITRDKYIEKLNDLLGHKYEKNSTSMYDEIKDKQEIAIKNAKQLLEQYQNGETPSQMNPSTTVFVLVEELNKYLN